eukprot:TRINITY_DN32_c1_g1_i5.p3 TRINITY_DN32_c1_g1~~TRINITY_DN32_c1_g1_i5.p3  ORF type:complete len:284 (+),score=-15.51 TRINITY_DN32_c1_g1_i5:257-1108(+)
MFRRNIFVLKTLIKVFYGYLIESKIFRRLFESNCIFKSQVVQHFLVSETGWSASPTTPDFFSFAGFALRNSFRRSTVISAQQAASTVLFFQIPKFILSLRNINARQNSNSIHFEGIHCKILRTQFGHWASGHGNYNGRPFSSHTQTSFIASQFQSFLFFPIYNNLINTGIHSYFNVQVYQAPQGGSAWPTPVLRGETLTKNMCLLDGNYNGRPFSSHTQTSFIASQFQSFLFFPIYNNLINTGIHSYFNVQVYQAPQGGSAWPTPVLRGETLTKNMCLLDGNV